MTGRFSRHAGRPLLLAPLAAQDLAARARAFDAHALTRPRSWLDSPLRALSRLAKKPDAPNPNGLSADESEGPLLGPAQPTGYAPAYASAPSAEHAGWSLVEGVACLEITGPLMDRGFQACGATWWGYDLVASVVTEAVQDPLVQAVFVRIDSPGGVVAGTLEEATAAWRGAREAAGGKPIWVYADCALSAAYWIAAQADWICAPAVGLVGSIGAVVVHEEYSGALAREGVTVTPIQFGAKKTDGAPWKTLSPEALADLQAEVDECGRRFVADVARGRPGLSPDALIATQAAVYLASHAEAARSGVALGLVDQVCAEAAAFAALKAHLAARAHAPAPAPSPSQTVPAPAARAPAAAPKSRARAQNRKEQIVKTTHAAVSALTPDEHVAKIQEILDTDVAPEDKLTLIEQTFDAPAEEPAPEEAPPEEAPAELAAAALKTAQAILALPEARGREGLAQALAFAPGATVAFARTALAAAPRASQKLAAVPDPKLGAGGDVALSGDERAAQAALADYRRATGKAPRGAKA